MPGDKNSPPAGAKSRGLVSLSAGTHNLPRELSSFVGRQDDVEDVARRLESSPLVTITGLAGMGKTRLALQVARRMVTRFQEGPWLVELALVSPTDDPSLVAEELASVFDLRPEPGHSYGDALVTRLRATPTVLVLDNCEHLIRAAAVVVSDLLRTCPGLSVLATSQQPLGIDGEVVRPLAPMSLPDAGPSEVQAGAASDAVALFYARAKTTQAGFLTNAEGSSAVAEICRRLDGVPLAIELAAGRVGVLSPTEILEHLEHRFGFLTRAGTASTPRHQTLQSALDWSYELLPESEKALLRRISIFAGGAGLAEVRDVCVGGEVTRSAVVDLLGALVSKSLVTADTSGSRARYRLLETVRAHARVRLIEAEEHDEVAERHAQWFIAFAERGWHQVVAADSRGGAELMEAQHDNLRAALGWLLEHGHSHQALQLCSALTPFWKARGHFREGRSWLERSLAGKDISRSKAPPSVVVRGMWGVGLLSLMQGDLDRATSVLEQTLDTARKHHHDRAAISALNLLGFISVFTGNPAGAMARIDEGVALARADNDTSSLISALSLYGRACLFAGDTARALKVFDECVTLGRSMNDGDESDGLLGLGWVALSRGEFERSEALLREVLTLLRQADVRFETAMALSLIGEVAWRRGDNEGARSALEEGMALAQAMGAPFPLARCRLGLGRVAHAEGNLKASVELTEAALSLARQGQLPHALVRCLQARADLYRDSEDLEAAHANFDEAQTVATAHSDKLGAARSLRSLGVLARMTGDYRQAMSLLIEACDISVECDDAGGIADVAESLAGIAGDQDRAAHAVRLMAGAESLRLARGSDRSPLDAHSYQADLTGVRRALGVREFNKGWKQGSVLSANDLVGLIGRTRGGRRRPETGWSGLSVPERQVVDLVVEGLSNREIAERMFLSPRTVQGHLSRAFTRIGVKSRRELRDEARTLTDAK